MTQVEAAQGKASPSLAVDGGQPVRSRPFAPWPHFAEDEVAVATAVLTSGKVNYWTGDEGRAFEREFAVEAGCNYAVAVSNGSVALELALRVCGIGPGDEVIVPPRSFIASASCAVMVGAVPVMADVGPDSGTLDPDSIRSVLTPRTRAIIPVHLGGWPCDMDPIVALARKHDLVVIEDCAQAHGARYKGRPVGSIGDVAAFSFCQDKIITTAGEGGMLTTNSEAWWKQAWSFKDHGKSYDAVYHRQHAPGFRWLHESFGTNWRLTEIQSAVGRVQLRKLPEWSSARHRHAEILTESLSQIPALRVPRPGKETRHAFYKYYFYVRPELLAPNWSRDRILEAISAEGVPCFSGSCSEIYLEKAFPESMRPRSRLPVARELGDTSLLLLVHPTLCDDDMHDMTRAVSKVMAVASR